MKQLLGAVAVVSMLAACSGSAPAPAAAPQAGTAQDVAAIGKMFDEYAAAWKASDAARIGKLYADDAIILPGDHVAETGLPAIVKYNQDFFDEYTPATFDITQQETQITGDLAYNRGAFTFSAMPKKTGGQPVSDRGKYIVILRRQADGTWKWSRDIDCSDGMPAAAAAAPAVKTQG
jgi:uncharacterized protein (TIGR02246 family)